MPVWNTTLFWGGEVEALVSLPFAVHEKETVPLIVCFVGGVGCLFLLLSPTARKRLPQYFRQFKSLSRQIKWIRDK